MVDQQVDWIDAIQQVPGLGLVKFDLVEEANTVTLSNFGSLAAG
jgi:hypothetical protein